MKARVKTYLNERTQKPSVNAPNYHYYSPGDEIEITEIVNGDEYEGNEVWYKLDNDSYVWSGGVEGISKLIDDYFQSKFTIDEFWWLKDYYVDKLWEKGLTGKGVKIAVIDTGISLPHPDLNVAVTQCADVTNSPTGYLDQNGHGTHCAGIIKGSNNGLGINGIAYDCEVYSCKITHDQFLDSMVFLEEGIKWATNMNVDIISISKGFPNEEKNIEEVISEVRKKNISLVVAGGNNYRNTKFNNLFFPAVYKDCLAIGAVDENKNLIWETIISDKEMLLAPGKNIKSSYLNKSYLNLSGTSQAAPFVAGIMALMIQFLRDKGLKYNILKLEEQLIISGDRNNQSDFKIINPSNLIKLIENAPDIIS